MADRYEVVHSNWSRSYQVIDRDNKSEIVFDDKSKEKCFQEKDKLEAREPKGRQ